MSSLLWNFFWLTPSTWTSVPSLPKEVCSVILDAECMRPIHTACNMVEPSEQCQLVLRHFFNDSGIYCINVSLANDVSLAAATAKISVDMGTHTYTHESTQHYVTVFSTSVHLCWWQCGLCCRFWSVLSQLSRHSVWCPGTGPCCGHSGLHLQVGTLFSLDLWPYAICSLTFTIKCSRLVNLS